MKKILFTATHDIHLAAFHKPYIKWLSDQGYIVDIAVENVGNEAIPGVSNNFHLEFPRSLSKRATLFSTYKKLKEIIDKGNYDLVHCHNPIPSFLTRLAARKARKRGTKVLYTAHGFHFYKGAPWHRWLVYYSAEYLLSAFSDGIVTINHEDFKYISKGWMHKDSFYIKGIGVDSTRFKVVSDEEKRKIRKETGLLDNDFVILYLAEFIPRKNHKFLLNSFNEMIKVMPNAKLLLAGSGVLLNDMKKLTRTLHLQDNVIFLGFRKDVHLYTYISHLGVSTSIHEGLGLGLAEQMMCGVPIVATLDRGHKEMIENGINGYMFPQGDTKAFVNYVKLIYENPEHRIELAKNAITKSKEFGIENSLKSMILIYDKYLS